MDDFKVSLESLYTNKIKEISFDEEESYQEWAEFLAGEPNAIYY